MGEAKRRRLAGDVPSTSPARERPRTLPEVTTTIAIHYKGATLRSEIDPADVDRLLADVDGLPVAAKDRDGARSWVLDTLRRNGHLTDDGKGVTMTLLWLMCRHPELGPYALTLARHGDATLAYDVTENLPDVRATRGTFNWRAIVGPSDVVAPQIPWLPPADITTAGSA